MADPRGGSTLVTRAPLFILKDIATKISPVTSREPLTSHSSSTDVRSGVTDSKSSDLLASERDTIRGVQIRAGAVYVYIYIYICMEVRVL